MSMQPSATAKQAGDAVENIDNKYLTFTLGKKEYGVDIVKVREIIGYTDVTPVPRAPEYMKGVIDLRDKIVPIIDLRVLLGMPEKEVATKTCVVIVELDLPGSGSQVLVGFVVDAMREVRQIDKEQIERSPSLGQALDTELIRGFGKLPTGIVVLLNIDQVLTSSDTEALTQALGNMALEAGGASASETE